MYILLICLLIYTVTFCTNTFAHAERTPFSITQKLSFRADWSETADSVILTIMFSTPVTYYTDIYLLDGTNLRNVHASTKLGERYLPINNWTASSPPFSWEKPTLWTASIFTEPITPMKIQRYAFSKTYFTNNSFQYCIEAHDLFDRQTSLVFPEEGNSKTTSTYLQYSFHNNRRLWHHSVPKETELPSGDIFTITPLTDNIYAAIPQQHILINANSLIIDAGDYYIFTESHASDEVAKRLYRQVANQLGNKPIRYVFLTHNHFDHASGSGGYYHLFPNVQIISTHTISEELAREDKNAPFLLDNYIATNISKGAIPASDSAEFWKTSAALSHKQKALPNTLFEQRYEIKTGQYTIQAFERKGHSNSDVILYIPEAKIAVTGDILHSYDPILHTEFFSWIETLHFIQSIPATTILGGHGGILHQQDSMATRWLQYFSDLQTIATNLDTAHIQQLEPEYLYKQLSMPSQELLQRVALQHQQYLHPIYHPNIKELCKQHILFVCSLLNKK